MKHHGTTLHNSMRHSCGIEYMNHESISSESSRGEPAATFLHRRFLHLWAFERQLGSGKAPSMVQETKEDLARMLEEYLTLAKERSLGSIKQRHNMFSCKGKLAVRCTVAAWLRR